MFDEPTRLARYESMRKGPGRRASRHKQLFMLHMDLEKACTRTVSGYERNTRIATADVDRQRVIMQKRKIQLAEQVRRFAVRRERTHTLLESFREQHAVKQRSWTQIQEQVARKTKRRIELAPFPFDVDYHYRSHRPSGELTPQGRMSPSPTNPTTTLPNLLAPACQATSPLRHSGHHQHRPTSGSHLPAINTDGRSRTLAY